MRGRRIAGVAASALLLAAMAAGCAPEPASEATPDPTGSSQPTRTAPTSAVPSSSPSAIAGIELPADCTDISSPEMLATLQEKNPPLNDPGVTMLSTQQAPLLELLEGLPTIRCSWGMPSEYGLATNVSLVTAEQRESVLDALQQAGFGCEPGEGGTTICRIEARGLSLDDVEYTRGETHALRDNAWISTSWLNFSPDGYTEDILATLGM